MKRLLLVAAIAATALGAAACTGCSEISKLAGAATSDKALAGATVLDDKAMYAAEAAAYGADQAANAALDAGLLKAGSPEALAVAKALDDAHKGLVVARDAKAVGDAAGFSARISAVQGAIADAWKLIPTQAKG